MTKRIFFQSKVITCAECLARLQLTLTKMGFVSLTQKDCVFFGIWQSPQPTDNIRMAFQGVLNEHLEPPCSQDHPIDYVVYGGG